MNAEDGIPVEHSTPGVVRLALALFCGSLVSLILFNLLPAFDEKEAGWVIWVTVFEVIQTPDLLHDFSSMVFLASLLTLPILVITSPFLTKMYFKSRLTWWLASLMAGITTIFLWFLVLLGDAWPNFGLWCLLAAPALNFAGLLSLGFAKRAEDPPCQS